MYIVPSLCRCADWNSQIPYFKILSGASTGDSIQPCQCQLCKGALEYNTLHFILFPTDYVLDVTHRVLEPYFRTLYGKNLCFVVQLHPFINHVRCDFLNHISPHERYINLFNYKNFIACRLLKSTFVNNCSRTRPQLSVQKHFENSRRISPLHGLPRSL